MSEEKKGDETIKKVGSISYAAYEEADTFDWTQVCRKLPLSLLPFFSPSCNPPKASVK